MRSDEADLARLYHAHTCHDEACSIETELDDDALPLCFRTYPGAPRTPLPGRDFAVRAALGDVLAARRSVREFAPVPLPLAALGRLLFASYGAKGQRDVGGMTYTRSAPSAGGKYPLEIYVAAQRVEGLEDGIFHYDARAHELERVRPGLAQPALVHLCLDQEMVRDANVVAVVTAIRERTMWKYGQRGYRYVWLDAGHLGENLYLLATAMGLGAVGIGGFFDRELAALLNLPGDEEPFYVVCIGRPKEVAP